MKLVHKFLAALTVATLLYGGQLRMYTDARNRFLEHWERADGMSLLAGIALLALAFTAARELLARTRFCPWRLREASPTDHVPDAKDATDAQDHGLRRVADHLFVLLFGGAAISGVLTYADYKSELLYLALVAGVTASWFRPRFLIPRRAAQLALLFSPIAAIVALQLCRYAEWSTPRETPSPQFPPRAASPVFVFIFDEWSYARSTERGAFLPLFKNLRAFADQSFVFHDARSPGPRTDESVPRILYQTADELLIGPAQTVWEYEGKRTPTAERPSLFQLAREHEYNSALLGFYLPQRRILGAQPGYVDSMIEHPKPDAFPAKIAANALRNVQFQLDPLSRRVQRALEPTLAPHSQARTSRHWEKMTQHLRRETRAALASAAPNTFAVFHLPLPHGPWIFNADGSYVGPFKGERLSHDVAGYLRHLGFLDLVIGEFLDALKQAGTFEQSMIVMTSDHSWRRDYTFDGRLADGPEVRHVPLFIKLPGQRETVRVEETFKLIELKPAIEAVLSGRVEEARAALPGSAR